MSFAFDHLRLLIAHDSQDEAEQLMNALRTAGRATRAKLALSEDEFLHAVKENTWELILCRPVFGDADYAMIVGHLRRLGKAIPVILIADEYHQETVLEGLEKGASAVVPRHSNDLLLKVIDKELDVLRLRQELQSTEIELHDAEKRLGQLMAQSKDAIAYVLDGMHIHANGNYVALFGYDDTDDLAGVPIIDMVAASDKEKLKKLLRQRAKDESQTQEMHCKGVSADGKEFDASFTFSPSTYDGEVCTQIVIRTAGVAESDIEERVHVASQTDPVTGLPNRLWLMDQLDVAVAKAAKGQGLSALLCIRLDRFEQLQADYGIDGGDMVLKSVATTLEGQQGKLAKLDGEDFALLVDVEDTEQAATLAHDLVKHVNTLMPEIGVRTVQVTASIGVAFAREDARNGQQILTTALKYCNLAQRENEQQGGGIKVHDPMDDVAAGSSEALAMLVRQALEKNGFKLQYQPLLCLEDQNEHIFEVFVSLPQSKGEVLKAKEFIPVAVNHKLIGKIDRWVTLNAMREALAAESPVGLLVNLKGESLAEPGLAEWLIKAVKASGLPPERLTFQFTEGDATEFMKVAGAFARKMVALGCGVSISRFGGNLDPFKIFQHIPATMVKFESAFIQELNKPEGREQLAEVIAKVKQHGCKAVVGFVETAQQMQSLWTLGGVDYLQGFYLQGPMDRMHVADTVE